MSSNISNGTFWLVGMMWANSSGFLAASHRRDDLRLAITVIREKLQVAPRGIDGFFIALHEHIPASGDLAMHARAAHIFQGSFFPDDHFSHTR